MYKQHFGLQRALFEGGIAREEDVFLGPRQQLVIANLKIAFTTRDSVATLVGPIGVGKTTLASRALRMATTRLALGWVGSGPLTPDELLEMLLAEFDFSPYGMGRVERLQTWRQFVNELSVTDTRICILVENAQAVGIEVLQALASLTAADPNGCPGANLVIMGQAGLYQFFEHPALSHLKQRIRSRQRLDPLSVAEVAAYLRCRTTAAGGDFEAVFAPGAAEALHCYTAGIPRVIDNVCETALSLAAARRLPRMTPVDLMRVAERVYGLAPTGPVPAFLAQASTEPPAQPAQTQAPAQAPVAAPAAAETPPAPPSGAGDAKPAAPDHAPVAEAAPSADEASVEDGGDGREQAVEVLLNEDDAGDDTDAAGGIDAAEEIEEAVAPGNEATNPAVPPLEPPVLTDVVADTPGEETVAKASDDAELGDFEMDYAAIASAVAADDAPAAEATDEEAGDRGTAAATSTATTTATATPTEATPEPEELEAQDKASMTLAEAKSLEDISNSMAEALFGDGEMEMLGAALEAGETDAAPGTGANPGLSPDETSAVLALEEDAIAEEPEAAPTPPPIEATS